MANFFRRCDTWPAVSEEAQKEVMRQGIIGKLQRLAEQQAQQVSAVLSPAVLCCAVLRYAWIHRRRSQSMHGFAAACA